jgi:hypothetical protein
MAASNAQNPRTMAARFAPRGLWSLVFLCIGLWCFAPVQPSFAAASGQDSSDFSRSNESQASADSQEGEFQDDMDTMFDAREFAVDTFAWDNWKINSGHFESDKWADTARIALVDSSAGQFYVHPFRNVVTSDFGLRHWLWHKGVDIRLAKGDTVRAAFDGIVRVTKKDRRGYGNVVVIRHPCGLETIYGHLSRVCAACNAKVKAGDVIGLGGSTGRSTGCHLHFEMRYYGEPFDPNCIIDFEAYGLRSDTLVLTRGNFNYLAELRKEQWHTVHKGETLGHIALRYHTSIKNICLLNHLTPRSLLGVGRKLLVSGKLPGPSRSSFAPAQKAVSERS